MNCFHYTPGYLSLSRKNLSWHKNNFHSFPHISLLSTLALLKNWGIVFLPAAPRPAFSSNHTPQSVGRKLTTLRERTVRIRKVVGSIPIGSTKNGNRRSFYCGDFSFGRLDDQVQLRHEVWIPAQYMDYIVFQAAGALHIPKGLSGQMLHSGIVCQGFLTDDDVLPCFIVLPPYIPQPGNLPCFR